MLKVVKASLAFMTTKERRFWYTLTGLRSLLALLDLAGILTIGFVLSSTAVFLTAGSDPSRVLEFAGFQIPAVNAQTLPWVAATVLLLFLGKAFLSLLLTQKVAFLVATVEARSARTIAEVSFGGDLGDARKRSREEIMYAIQAGSPSAFNTVLNSANAFISEATLFVVICLGFLLVDPLATLAAITYFGLIALVIQYSLGSLMSKAAKVGAESTVQANAAISDLIAVFRELLVLGKRTKYINGIYNARISAADSSAKQFFLSGMPRYIIEASLLVGVALFVLAQSLTGDIVQSAATIGVFLSGGFRLTAALLPMQNSLLTVKSAIPAASTALEILKFGEIENTPHVKSEKVINRDKHEQLSVATAFALGVKFEKVSFIYPGSEFPAIDEVSFEIEPGSQVALMGPSGAGKSTIADLLCKVIKPTHGDITIGGHLAKIGEVPCFDRVSYVPQRPGVVSGTILDNVALAVDENEVDRDHALRSLGLAHLSELVSELPDGLDTPLGKLQDGLSGGQMQRLGLARALYTNPGLLVMDEATSALDAESEAEIQKALNDMRGKVTVVLIAHRLNTIQHADKVVLVEEGRVKDVGTFKELLARNPSVERVVDLMRVEKD